MLLNRVLKQFLLNVYIVLCVGMCGIVILFQFGFGSVFEKKTLIWFRMSLVWFEKNVRFGYCSYLLLM